MDHKKKPIFTVDLEDWHHALHIDQGWYSSLGSHTLIEILKKFNIKAIFYVLGRYEKENPLDVEEIRQLGHVIKSHGYYHDKYEFPSDRSPYWSLDPMPFPPSGGFFFRFMPYWYVKWAIKKSYIFWIHPHDLDELHPRIKPWWLNWKRHVGLKGARKKLERLCKEIEWEIPS